MKGRREETDGVKVRGAEGERLGSGILVHRVRPFHNIIFRHPGSGQWGSINRPADPPRPALSPDPLLTKYKTDCSAGMFSKDVSSERDYTGLPL